MKIKNTLLVAGLSTISLATFAQKKNVTSAAVEYNKVQLFQKLFTNTLDIPTATKTIQVAKGFIDEAAKHPDTQNDQKQFWYTGNIYSAIGILSSMDSTAFDIDGEVAMKKALTAYQTGAKEKGRYKTDIMQSAENISRLFLMGAPMAYEKEMYAEAGEAYFYAAEFNSVGDNYDTSNYYNAAVCYDLNKDYSKAGDMYAELSKLNYKGTKCVILASASYRKASESQKALDIVNEARKNHPNDKDLLLELVNTNIDIGNAEGAEKALSDAIAADPNNKQLYYTIGTIYNDLKENEKAEEALNKALEIDPNYADAQYQLGAILVTWASDIKLKADQLPFGDSQYNVLLKKSSATYERALIPLEKYILNYADDKAVLTILFQIHRNLGNSEKALEYKKRADAI